MSNGSKPRSIASQRSFVKLLGAEYDLMRSSGILKRFYVAALLIVMILLLTCLSIFYAIELLFHSVAVEIALALFFSLLFICIYIFLLNTFSKEDRKQKKKLNCSDFIRIGFIAFMGFLIAQPLIILLYAAPLSADVARYKEQLLKTHRTQIIGLTEKETKKLVTRYHYYQQQKQRSQTTTYDEQIDRIDRSLQVMQAKARALEFTATHTIAANSFFLYRIKKVNGGYAFSWLWAIIIVALFMLPALLIYAISGEDHYYQQKKALERKLITDAYHAFTEHYKKLWQHSVTIFSRYIDPPFNTIRRKPPVSGNTNDFIQKYIDNR
ncbi:DUF4407 domain-containing protein [Niabella sp. CC-SYL272]|uniref:DUF4407 domain-containing protein n=1 Tax=Niabella agricola TaxID=2891571 RepID=UPI001F1AB8C5|nr:DUF4407 domain-containing protein [Niabella agricola]MCF3110252.1 DUF4407 domain-containing protein [Niabella agricola]